MGNVEEAKKSFKDVWTIAGHVVFLLYAGIPPNYISELNKVGDSCCYRRPDIHNHENDEEELYEKQESSKCDIFA